MPPNMAPRLLDMCLNVRARGLLHSIDDMIVKDRARTYPMATGREVRRAMVAGRPRLHGRKAGHVDDDTRRTMRKAWEVLGHARTVDARKGTWRR